MMLKRTVDPIINYNYLLTLLSFTFFFLWTTISSQASIFVNNNSISLFLTQSYHIVSEDFFWSLTNPGPLIFPLEHHEHFVFFKNVIFWGELSP